MTGEQGDTTGSGIVDPVADLHARAELVRGAMGGEDRVSRMREEGTPTIRNHIAALLDEGSFRELGTFTRSM